MAKKKHKPPKVDTAGKDRGFRRASVLFLLFVTLFNLAIYLLSEVHLFEGVIGATTTASALLIRLVGIDAGYSYDRILLESQPFIVTLECTGVFIMALFAALVLAYPADTRRKLIGLIVGIPAIAAMNVLRIVALAVVSENYLAYFDYFHDYVWQVAFILLTAGLWIAWMGKGEGSEAEASLSR